MTSIGKVQAALAAVTNEVTIAAANLNFDFTLVKCEAPKEYNELGDTLSKRSKDNAEYGSIHVTARRLGALFEGILPPTPNLLLAYGTRVSEIAQLARRRNPSEPKSSMFAAHSGIDGTSIWAAATSSRTALHVQLLACMLARVWKPDEAISIWYELVKKQRQQVEERFNGEHVLPYSTLSAAAQSPITRVSLAEWDASARSWLQTADRIKVKEQDQLTLLIANLNEPVNGKMVLYDNIIDSWISALESLEKLTTGMPQAGDHGPCLLALSSWHIYPDILLPGSTSHSHRFSDPVVKSSGTLTLGLGPRDSSDNKGVFWSLSLAHLNHYGRPVSKFTSLGLQSRSVTFEQFTHAVFGAFLGHWELSGSDAKKAARFFIAMRSAIRRAAISRKNDRHSIETAQTCSNLLRDKSHGLNILEKAANTYIEALNVEDDIIHKIVAFGKKRAKDFLPSNVGRSFFGYNDISVVIRQLSGPDQRIAFLRRLAAASHDNRGLALIRYYDDADPTRLCGLASVHAQLSQHDLQQPHARWAPRTLLKGRPYANETVIEIKDTKSRDFGSTAGTFQVTTTSSEGIKITQDYRLLCGDDRVAAIYANSDFYHNAPASLTNMVATPPFEHLIWCMNSDMFDMGKVIKNFDSGLDPLSAQDRTLKSIAVAHEVYQALPDASVSMLTLEQPLYLGNWAKNSHATSEVPATANVSKRVKAARTNRSITLGTAFSCVACLGGAFDIEPSVFERVFAIAYDDSIYASIQLTCDPWEKPNPYELRRIAGNIGRPGLTLLIPPRNPILSSREESSWRIVSTTEFKGRSENCFSLTSMHLSFTDYYVPCVSSSGNQVQDNQVYFLESVVSVYHAGNWIGDVDVLQCLKSYRIIRREEEKCNGHHEPCDWKEVLAVDNWADVLDPPHDDHVIQAHGSWLARLAITTIFVQARTGKGESIVGDIAILPKTICWQCTGDSIMSGRHQRQLEGPGLSTSSIPGAPTILD